MNPERSVVLGIGSRELPPGLHVCYLFDDDAERLALVARFLDAGRRARDKLLYAVDTMTPEELRERLGSLVAELGAEGAFVAMGCHDAYFPLGTFSVERMLGTIRSFYLQALEEGMSGARGTGEMSWMKRGVEGTERVMEYEARVTQLVRAYPYTALCQYDIRLFAGETIMDVLTVHPYTIVRGQVVENPFFIPPDEFLKSRQSTRAADDARRSA